MRLENQVAIVTGAAQGLGRAYAEILAREGANLVLVDLDDCSETVALVKNQGRQCMALSGDISDEAFIKDMAAQTTDQLGSIEVLVNNAALLSSLSIASMHDISLEEFDAIMRVNVRGTFQCVRAVAPQMIKQGYGKIVNISSTTAMFGSPMVHYVASKGAVMSMTYSFARELGEHGICVNTLAVGLTESEALNKQAEENPELINMMREMVVSNRLIKKPIYPQDMAKAMLFLASSDSDFVTGQTLAVDGGFVLH